MATLDCSKDQTYFFPVPAISTCRLVVKRGRKHMSQPQLGRARASIGSLRDRLQDITALLHSIESANRGMANGMGANLAVAIRAIGAVSEDLESVCNDQLWDGSFQDARALEARSELDADEFDSQS
jgi:hypothetical protein